MEITFMNQVARSANLRPILRNPALREAMGDVLDSYSKVINEDSRGTRIRDALSLEEQTVGVGIPFNSSSMTKLDDDVFEALLNRLNNSSPEQGPLYIDEYVRARPAGSSFLHRSNTPCKAVKIGGVKFQPERCSLKDSNILYSDALVPHQVHAGRIKHIFLHKRPSFSSDQKIEQTFLVVHRLKVLDPIDKNHDHFSRYPGVGGSLYYDEYEPIVDIVIPTEVLCHFARTSYKSPSIPRSCVHVLALDRVRFHSLIID